MSTVDQDVSSLAKTPECPPPPLVSSTVNVPMTGGRRRKIESVEPAIGDMMRTPECPPPPLSSSTVDVTMNGSKRKKKLFTERLGPQEL